MIVRILGEGQYELSESARSQLDELDGALDKAVEAGQEEAFQRALVALIGAVRETGTAIDPTRLIPSDLALPGAGASLDEVRALLASEATADS